MNPSSRRICLIPFIPSRFVLALARFLLFLFSFSPEALLRSQRLKGVIRSCLVYDGCRHDPIVGIVTKDPGWPRDKTRTPERPWLQYNYLAREWSHAVPSSYHRPRD